MKAGATTISSVLGNHGARPRLTDPDTGRVWEVGYITHKVMSEYEMWLRGEALAAVMAQRGRVPDDAYRELLREVSQDIASGAYAYEGEMCARSLASPGGAVALTGLLLWDPEARRHPTREELADLSRRLPGELNAVVNLVASESVQRLRPAAQPGAGADENPTTTAGGSASTPS